MLLVWDAPNLDMGLGAILGGRPTAAYRPRFDALGRWLLGRTADLSAGAARSAEPEATVFTNIAQGSADVVRPWVEALRNVGFAVFAKPKIDEDSDVDADMLAHIALRAGEGLAGLVVASADGQAFREPLEEIAARGVPVQVIGFREHAAWAVSSEILGVRRPRGHPRRVPGTAAAGQPRLAARRGRLAAAVPPAVGAAVEPVQFGSRLVFARWGALVYRLRYTVIGVMVATLLGLGAYGLGLEDHLSQSGWDDPGSEASRAAVLADQVYGRDHTADVIALYTAPEGKTSTIPTSAPRSSPTSTASRATIPTRSSASTSLPGRPRPASRSRSPTHPGSTRSPRSPSRATTTPS